MSEIIYQPQLWFFDDPSVPPDQRLHPPPSDEERAWWVDPKNAGNPLSTFIGSEAAVRRLSRFAFQAFGRYNRQCSDFSFALLGPPSTGKTTLVRLFAELIGLPFVEIDGVAFGDLNDIATAIAETMERTEISCDAQYSTLELQDLGNGKIVIPPCVVFINEVHRLPKKIFPDLRKVFAGRFETNGWTFDSSAICWIVASDDLVLHNVFDRLMQVRLKPLSVDEVAQVVALHNPDFPTAVCRLIAQQVRTPREALIFAREVVVEAKMHGDLERAITVVASDLGLEKPTPWTNRLNGRNGRH